MDGVYWTPAAEAVVRKQVTVALNTRMERAVISFAEGVNGADGKGFAASGMPKVLNERDFKAAAAIFVRPSYYKLKGKAVASLKRLRFAEQAMFLEGLAELEATKPTPKPAPVEPPTRDPESDARGAADGVLAWLAALVTAAVAAAIVWWDWVVAFVMGLVQ